MTRTHRTNSAYAALAALTACALRSTPTFAQGNWPNKPIHLVVPFAAGGANDWMARSAAEGASKTWTPRSSAFTPLSTAAEQGFAEVQIAHWAGIHAPAGTPAAVMDKIAAAVDKAMHEAATVEKLKGLGIEPIGGTRPEFVKFVDAERKRLGEIVKAAHMQEK